MCDKCYVTLMEKGERIAEPRFIGGTNDGASQTKRKTSQVSRAEDVFLNIKSDRDED